ncbi:MAG TPA: alpha/beta hydrolase [Saprospiraceae bacterium]|nr:alpha/beta hydrolase [Saprospiraceae bacterium]
MKLPFIFFLLMSLFNTMIFAQAEKTDTVESHQFFIQIIPNQSKVKCGRFRELDTLQITKIFFTQKDSSVLWSMEEALSLIHERQHERPLYYIHGFYASTPKLTQRTVLAYKKFFFEDEENQTTDIIHIVWDSNKLSYKGSQKNIAASRENLGKILNLVAWKSPKGKIDLVCHSMGNQFLMESIKYGFLTEKIINKLVLAAPDFDIGDFAVYQHGVEFVANQVLVLYNKKDRILAASRLRNHERRLGQRLPNKIHVDNFTFLDCSKMKINHSLIAKLNKHTYFLASDEARQKMHQFLNQVESEPKFLSTAR